MPVKGLSPLYFGKVGSFVRGLKPLHEGRVGSLLPSLKPLMRSSGGITSEFVMDNAGVTPGVTPGVIGTWQHGYGITSDPGDHIGFTPIVVNSRNAIKTLDLGGGDVAVETIVNGRYLYTVSNVQLYAPAGTASNFIWTDAANTTYDIKFKNCFIGQPDANFSMIDLVDTGNGTCTFEDCDIGGAGNVTANFALVKITAGNVVLNKCHFNRSTGRCIWKNGGSANITVTNSMFSNTEGYWAGNYGNQPIFYNSATGGTLTVDRCTFDNQTTAYWLHSEKNWKVTMNRVLWNPNQIAAAGSPIPTNTTDVTEVWDSGLTIRDSRFYTGTAASSGPIIGTNNGVNARGLANWLFEHCEFIVPVSFTNMTICLGDSATADPEHTKLITFRWCRFSRPHAAGDLTAGHESLFFFKTSDTLVEYCWTDECGEDAYEWSTPFRNNVIRYSGGGDVAGSYVGGNMVDFYGGAGIWNNANCTGNEAHHIWGTCGSDALCIDACWNVSYHDIDVDNSAGGFAQNPPVANIRLHARGAASFNAGDKVSLPISSVAKSYAGIPCLLTREAANATTVLATIDASNFTVNNATGFVIGYVISVMRDNGLAYYTLIDNVVGVTITLLTPLPTVTSAGKAVLVAPLYDAGACAWPGWTGTGFIARTGTHGGVDAIAT